MSLRVWAVNGLGLRASCLDLRPKPMKWARSLFGGSSKGMQARCYTVLQLKPLRLYIFLINDSTQKASTAKSCTLYGGLQRLKETTTRMNRRSKTYSSLALDEADTWVPNASPTPTFWFILHIKMELIFGKTVTG